MTSNSLNGVNQSGQHVGLVPVGANAAIQDQKMENLIKRILTVMAVIIALSLVLMAFGFACSMGVHGLSKIPSWIGSTSLGVGATLFIFSLGSIIALKILDKQRLEQKQKYTDELQKKTAELANTTAELENTTVKLTNTTAELENTTVKLTNTTAELENTTAELQEKIRELNVVLLTNTTAELQEKIRELNVVLTYKKLLIMIKKYSEKDEVTFFSKNEELSIDLFIYEKSAVFLHKNPQSNFYTAYYRVNFQKNLISTGEITSSLAMSQGEMMAFQIFRAAKKEIDTNPEASLDITLERFTQCLDNDEKISDWQDLVKEKNASLGNSTPSSSS